MARSSDGWRTQGRSRRSAAYCRRSLPATPRRQDITSHASIATAPRRAPAARTHPRLTRNGHRTSSRRRIGGLSLRRRRLVCSNPHLIPQRCDLVLRVRQRRARSSRSAIVAFNSSTSALHGSQFNNQPLDFSQRRIEVSRARAKLNAGRERAPVRSVAIGKVGNPQQRFMPNGIADIAVFGMRTGDVAI